MDYWIGLPGTEPDHMALEISFGQSPRKTSLLTSLVGQSIKQQRDTKTSQTATYWLLRGTEQQKVTIQMKMPTASKKHKMFAVKAT